MAFSTPLIVAAIAGVALIGSVGVDLAYDRSLRVEARGNDGAFGEVAKGSFDGDLYSRPPSSPSVAVDPNGTLELRYTLMNEYPWPTSATLYVSPSGCYADAIHHAEARLRAPASGEANAQATADVKQLRTEGRVSFEPFPVDQEFLSLTVCAGSRAVAQATLDLEDPS